MYKKIDKDSYIFLESKLAVSKKYFEANRNFFYKHFKGLFQDTLLYKTKRISNLTKTVNNFKIYDLDSIIKKAESASPLSDDEIKNLPEMKFIDENGFTFNIFSGDGENTLYEDVTKINVPQNLIVKSLRYDPEVKDKVLYVTFPISVRNAIIIYNLILEDYEFVSDTIIKYKNYKDFTDDDNINNDFITVQTWDKTKLERLKGPSGSYSGWLRMPYNMEDGVYIVSYNGLIYDYETQKDNPFYIRLVTEHGTIYDTFKEILDKSDNVITDKYFKIFKITSTDPKIKLIKKSYLGLNPYKSQKVEFPCEISNSMIIYEGTILNPDNASRVMDFSEIFPDTLSEGNIYSAIGWVIIFKIVYEKIKEQSTDSDCDCE